jgi:hypothetical protein
MAKSKAEEAYSFLLDLVYQAVPDKEQRVDLIGKINRYAKAIENSAYSRGYQQAREDMEDEKI